MDAGSIDRGSAVPLYAQVAADLRRRIRAGEFYPARRLPSQNDLAADYRVAVYTVRRALEVLRDEGLVVTYPGSGSDAVPPSGQ